MFNEARLLDTLQANILKSHGKDHVWCLFVQFLDIENSYRWLSKYLLPSLTSERKQQKIAEKWRFIAGKGQLEEDELTTCFFLSFKGCKKLSLDSTRLPNNWDWRFRMGLTSQLVQFQLSDPPTVKWEEDYQKEIHAMIMIANNSEKNLLSAYNNFTTSMQAEAAGKILFVEKGEKRYRGGHVIDAFGYRDGISQPQFWKKDGKLDIENALKVVLVPEDEQQSQYGSYLVFRKLEQDVTGFDQKILDLANKLQIPQELAEAQVMGRFKDGTPLALFEKPVIGSNNLSAEEQARIEKFDNYDPTVEKESDDGDYKGDYEDDTAGLKCPLHAHIRKTNPRIDDKVNADLYKNGNKIKTRIVRRGIPYNQPGKGVGLLFMSYQKDISSQFERIQRVWANKADFPAPFVGIDPIAGQPEKNTGGQAEAQQWNKGWNLPNTAEKIPFNLSDVVHFKGGEYFYAPSITFLENLVKNYID